MPLLYATEEEYKTSLGTAYDLLYIDESQDPPALNAAWFTADCAAVEAIINRYISHRYDVAKLTADSLLNMRALGVDLLFYLAYRHNNYAEMPEHVESDNKRAVAILLDYRNGKNFLAVTEAAAEPDASDGTEGPFYFGGSDEITFDGEQI